jgi:hypothetical protein
MRIDLATESLDSVASLIIGNKNLNQSRLIRKITKKHNCDKNQSYHSTDNKIRITISQN